MVLGIWFARNITLFCKILMDETEKYIQSYVEVSLMAREKLLSL